MQCDQARRLFDAYLDGELSASQATELGAHRVECPECRRALALLEVADHVLSSDVDPVTTPDGFTNRLLACINRLDRPKRGRFHGFKKNRLRIGFALAAAVLVLAAVGLQMRTKPRLVAGKKEPWQPPDITEIERFLSEQPAEALEQPTDVQAGREEVDPKVPMFHERLRELPEDLLKQLERQINQSGDKALGSPSLDKSKKQGHSSPPPPPQSVSKARESD